MKSKGRSRYRNYSKKGGRKASGTSFFSKLRRFPLWGYITVILAAIALYCFVLLYFFVDPYSFQWRAIYGETTYPKGYTIRGIDVSHYQHSIDWDKLRNASMGNVAVSFVFIKATEGNSLVDEYFNENFYRSGKNDFVRGAYHFLTPDVPADDQARFYLQQVHLEKGDLPPVLDIEDDKRWNSSGLSHTEIQKMALKWLNVVGQHYHVHPIIYSSYRFRKDILTDSVFNRYPFWMAHYYVKEPHKDINWTFWQHTDCGRISGIHGKVDCNLFNGNRDSFEELLLQEDDY